MTDLSGYREGETLDAMAAGGLYVALHTADEGNNPDGTNEVSADDYDRVEIAEADWSISGDGPTELVNDVAADFGNTDSDWGDLQYASLWDGPEDTDNPETSTITLDNGGEAPEGIDVEIPAGDITFEID